MKKRAAGIVSVTLGALGGCGEPAMPDGPRPQAIFSSDLAVSDSLKGEGWRKYLQAQTLHAAWVPPPKSPWRPYYKPTLVSAVSVVQSAARPVRAGGANVVELEASEFVRSTALQNAAVFVDLPGEQSVTWAAILHRRGLQPVVTINNWPHQRGILRLERPLGALLYYAEEIARDRSPEDAPPVFILEGTRLSYKSMAPRSDQFDNRFFYAGADFPPAEALRARQILTIYYVNPRGTTSGSEEEDLNDYFAALSNAGIQFAYVKPVQGNFDRAFVTPSRRPTIFTPAETARYTRSGPYHRHYYYYHSNYWSRSPGAWGSGTPGASSGGSRSLWSGGSS